MTPEMRPVSPKLQFSIRGHTFDLEEPVVWHIPDGRTGRVVGVSGISLVVLTAENFIVCVSIEDMQRFQ